MPGILVVIGAELENVTVTATEDSFSETVSAPPGPSQVSLVLERPGTYLVEVKAPGYVTWTVVVNVIEDGCHVETVQVIPELVPVEG